MAFDIYVTHIEAKKCPERTTHCSIIFWGQTNRKKMKNIENNLIAIKNIPDRRAPENISEWDKGFCSLQIEDSCFRVELDGSLIITTGAEKITALVKVFCVDYGFKKQVRS